MTKLPVVNMATEFLRMLQRCGYRCTQVTADGIPQSAIAAITPAEAIDVMAAFYSETAAAAREA